jgi:hypothetical protein
VSAHSAVGRAPRIFRSVRQPCSALGRRCASASVFQSKTPCLSTCACVCARRRPHFFTVGVKSGKQSAKAAFGCLLSLCSFSFTSVEVQMKGCRQILHCAAGQPHASRSASRGAGAAAGAGDPTLRAQGGQTRSQ